MADSAAENAAFSAKVVFGFAAAFYLLLLTWKVTVNFLLMGMRFPTGWPETIPTQLWAWVFVVLLGLSLISAAALWIMCGGFLLRGREWLATRSRWLLASASVAPVLFLCTAIGSLRKALHSSSADHSHLSARVQSNFEHVTERMMALAIGNMIWAAMGIVLFSSLCWMSRRIGT